MLRASDSVRPSVVLLDFDVIVDRLDPFGSPRNRLGLVCRLLSPRVARSLRKITDHTCRQHADFKLHHSAAPRHRLCATEHTVHFVSRTGC
jgi:hypothetical protein